MRSRNYRRIVGKRVRSVRLRSFRDRSGTYSDPMIEFEGGIFLSFHVQETQCGSYGVELLVHESEDRDG
jgi:hypothetical protein